MSTTLDKLIDILKGERGYRESGTNHQKYSPAVPGLEWSQDEAWCNTFTSWGYLKAGLRPGTDFPVTASCLASVAWYKAHGRWHSTPKAGDQVLYGPGGGTHTEIVIAVSAGYITTIGGNTSGSIGGNYFNGDGVYQKTVSRGSSRIYGYGRPAGLDGTTASRKGEPMLGLRKGDKGQEVVALQECIKAAGFGKYLGTAGSDGDYGTATAEALRQVRLSVKSTAAKRKGAGDKVDAYGYSQLLAAMMRRQGDL